MNKDELCATLNDFLSHKEKRVFALDGKWGTGKTYLWNEFIKNNRSSIGENNIAYVSLFGLASIAQLEGAIFTNLEPKENKGIKSYAKNKYKIISKVIDKIPQVKDYVELVTAAQRYFVKDALICIDDLERCCDNLLMDEVFGLISHLKNVSGCRFVVIYNGEELNKERLETLDRYREKIFDVNVKYTPSTKECVEIVFINNPQIVTIYNAFRRLEISNIRIIKQTAWVIDYILKIINVKLEEGLIVKIIENIIVVSVVHYSRDYPLSYADIKTLQYEMVVRRDDVPADKLAAIRRIQEISHSYPDYCADIDKFVKTGTIESEVFNTIIQRHNEEEKRNRVTLELTNIWTSYSNNFIVSGPEFTERAVEFLDQKSVNLLPGQVDELCAVLSALDSSRINQEWKRNSLLNSIEHMGYAQLKKLNTSEMSPDVIARIEARIAEIVRNKPIRDIARKIAETRSWGGSDTILLLSYDESEYYNWLISDDDPYLIDIVNIVYGIFKEDKNYSEINKKIECALRRLAARDSLHRYRIEKIIGINIDSGSAEGEV